MAEERRRTVSPAPKAPGASYVREVEPASSPQRSAKKVSTSMEDLESDQLLKSLKENREKLCACFDIFQLLYQNSVPQRCLQHNNFLTLYCQNEQKMLCVNCIYGTVHHRLHTVAPIKNVFERVIEDNKIMEKKLQQAVETLKLTEKAAHDYMGDGEENLKKVLKLLDDEYDRVKSILADKYNQSRKVIIDTYSVAAAKNDILMEELKWLSTTYSEREKTLPRSNEEASVMYTHLVLSSLLEGDQPEPKIVKPVNFEELRLEHVGQLSRIRELVETGKVKQRRGMF